MTLQTENINFPALIRFTKREAEIVRILLARGKPSSFEMISTLLVRNNGANYTSRDSLRAIISKARGKLRAHGVAIEHKEGLGYIIPKEGKERLRTLCDGVGKIYARIPEPKPKPKPNPNRLKAGRKRYGKHEWREAVKQNDAFVKRMRSVHPEKERVLRRVG